MRGEQVVVRAYGDEALVRRVWDAGEHAVFIVSEQNFWALSAGRAGLWPVGFRRRDVFCYDDAAAQELAASGPDNPLEWERLMPCDEQES